MEVNIIRHLGVISERTYKGEVRRKEVNIVSWNGREPKVDIREWDENHDVAGKGLTLTKQEEMALCSILHEHLKGASNVD